ncbi:MAG TPA: M1 family aminopeptidase [Cytophagaceae bacterium]|jgi:aminopeptidase N
MDVFRYFILFNVLCLNIVCAQIHSEKSILGEIINSERSNARIEAAQGSSEKNYDVYYHRLRWNIDPDTFYISGSVTSYFTLKSNTSDSISFDFSNLLVVDSVIFHQQRMKYTRSNYSLNIRLVNPPSVGFKDSIFIYYKGNPLPDNRSFAKNKHRDGYIIATLSEPFGAREWWPCNQDLNDKIDSVDIFIKTPSIYRAASNGLLQSEITEGGNKIYHWKHRYPITAYLVGIAVSRYTVYSDYFIKRNDTLEILNYVFPYYADTAKALTPFTVKCLNLFDSLLIPYPFFKEKYGHAQWTIGGGMEHQTMSFMGNFSEELVSHELAHSWFGNLVTCGSWKDIWLNEGLTSYVSGLIYQYILGEHRWLQWKKALIDDIVSLPEGSVYVDDTTNADRIFSGRLTYNKGAMVSHQLRGIIKDKAFFEGLKMYLSDPKLKYNYAFTKDLQRHMETTSGMNLENYFNDWIYGQGYPIYDYSWTQDASNNITIQLKQQQSHPSVDLFELPLPFLLKNRQRDSLVVFENDKVEQSIQFNPGFKVDSVLLDPYHDIIHKIAGTTSISDGQLEGKVRIYPTITEDRIDVSNFLNLDINLDFYDAFGRLLVSKKSSEAFYLNTAQYPDGVYFIRLNANNQIVNYKVIKH